LDILDESITQLSSTVNGIGGNPGVLPPFTAIGLGNPQALANAYGSGIPSLGAFALASTGALGSNNPGALRGLSNVLLVSNLNEEVI
jgi:polypyrimidine tract-binding protein 2